MAKLDSLKKSNEEKEYKNLDAFQKIEFVISFILTHYYCDLSWAKFYFMVFQGEFYNYSGCGNTFNCNHPIVRQFILDCLR
jgi:hypothetical protein